MLVMAPVMVLDFVWRVGRWTGLDRVLSVWPFMWPFAYPLRWPLVLPFGVVDFFDFFARPFAWAAIFAMAGFARASASVTSWRRRSRLVLMVSTHISMGMDHIREVAVATLVGRG